MIEQKVGWCENGGGAGNFEKRVNFGVLFESESAESTKSVVLMCVSGKHRRGARDARCRDATNRTVSGSLLLSVNNSSRSQDRLTAQAFPHMPRTELSIDGTSFGCVCLCLGPCLRKKADVAAVFPAQRNWNQGPISNT